MNSGLCRGCMNPLKDQVVSMKHESIKNLFRLCTSLRIETDDKLPKYLCRKCFTKCNKWKIFQEKCKESENKFNEINSSKENEEVTQRQNYEKYVKSQRPFQPIPQVELVDVKMEVVELSSDSNDSDDDKFDTTLSTYTIDVIKEEEKEIPNPLILVVKKLPIIPCGSKTKPPIEQPAKYIFKCKECKQIYSNLLAYENHFKSAHFVQFTCNICTENFLTGEKLLNHQFSSHTVETLPEEYKCKVCTRGFDSKILYNEHVNDHKSLTCHVCNKQFMKYINLQSHIRLVHTSYSFECDKCDKKFKNTHSLVSHLKTHSDLRPYICHICGKTFNCTNKLRRHVLFVHELEAKFPCHLCSHKCKTEKQLKRHVELHTAEKTIACDVCPMMFKTIQTYKMHRRIHTGEKRFFCSVCNEGFLRDCSMKLHMKNH